MGNFHIYTQILQGYALFSGKIYTIGNIFTRPPGVTVATNFKSVCRYRAARAAKKRKKEKRKSTKYKKTKRPT